MPIIVKAHAPDPPDAGVPALIVGVTDAEAAVELELYGHTDFVDTAMARTASLTPSAYGENHCWAALADGADPDAPRPDEVLGYSWVHLPLQEDVTTAYVFVGVRPDARGQGVARRIAVEVAAFLDARGRTTAMAYVFSPGVASGPDALVAESGVGAVDGAAPGARWLVKQGFVLEQTERQSMLDVSDHAGVRALAARLADEASGFGGGDYELLGWMDETPDEHADGVALLASRMSTDVPTAGLEVDEQEWDAERVRVSEARQRSFGCHWVMTVARHRTTGVLAGYTRLLWQESNPAGVWQEETLVRSDHRGRRLGMLIKAANLVRLLDTNADAARVHTWNASENDWMLAINDTLGFRPTGLEGAWQRIG